ncbi:MAG: hypothetical protein A3K67_03400 [Euryarchaeota archaeon RBG_16_62_10]|nr:MAG: hypothetical protein A3K67_03400 [Euryarchaeota archaeon RBG_16_62_10]
MTALSKPVMAVLAAAMVVDLAIFSGVSVLKLTGFGTGLVLILLGLSYSYRQPAAAGLLIVSATAAVSIELTTLLEIRTLMIGVLGLLVPTAVLAWISLTAKDDPTVEETRSKRPVVLSATYGALCLLSIPIVLLVISFVSPGLSLRTTTMTEAAIMLVTAVAGGAFIMLRGPTQQTASAPPLREG